MTEFKSVWNVDQHLDSMIYDVPRIAVLAEYNCTLC